MGKTETIITVVLFNLFFIAFVVALLIFIIQYRQRKKEHLAVLENQRQQHQQELLTSQLEMQQQTMQHIGREIHDNVGQKLTLASLYTQQLSYENKVPQAHERIDTITTLLNQSLHDLRALSKSLTDNTIEHQSLAQLIEEERDKLNALKGTQVQFHNHYPQLQLPYHTKNLLFRIIQEFIQNSIKHAQSTAITVTLQPLDEAVQIEVNDNGKGFNPNKKYPGIGLQNMQKRAELMGAQYQLTSSPKGTHIQLIVPLTP